MNTAVLTGRQISQAMKVFIVSQAGTVADVTLQSSCHSEDESVLKVITAISKLSHDIIRQICTFSLFLERVREPRARARSRVLSMHKLAFVTSSIRGITPLINTAYINYFLLPPRVYE